MNKLRGRFGLPQNLPRVVDRDRSSYLSHLCFYHFIKASLIFNRWRKSFKLSIYIFKNFVVKGQLLGKILINLSLSQNKIFQGRLIWKRVWEVITLWAVLIVPPTVTLLRWPIPVADEWSFFLGLRAIVPWVAIVTTDFTRCVWVYGLDGVGID